MNDLRGILIDLNCKTRNDGSVFVTSPSLPCFSTFGDDLEQAIERALDILPEFLNRNHHLVAQNLKRVERFNACDPETQHAPRSYAITADVSQKLAA